MKCGTGRKRNGQWCLTETSKYKMANHFGKFKETDVALFYEMAAEKYDFKQCQRQDGTVYGVKDSSGCVQKGAKEVKANKGGEGGGHLTAKTNSKLAGAAAQGSEKSKEKYLSNLDKLGTHALRDQMTIAVGKAQGTSATESAGVLDTKNPEKQQMIITESFDRINKIRKEEGKKPMSLTSIIDGVDLQRLGIDPNKANNLAKQGKSVKGAIKKK